MPALSAQVSIYGARGVVTDRAPVPLAGTASDAADGYPAYRPVGVMVDTDGDYVLEVVNPATEASANVTVNLKAGVQYEFGGLLRVRATGSASTDVVYLI